MTDCNCVSILVYLHDDVNVLVGLGSIIVELFTMVVGRDHMPG